MSVGYHGDDGHLYYNISRNVCLDELIQMAQVDSEKLLESAATDSSLFDISN